MITVLHKRNPVTGGHYRKTLQFGFDMQQAIDWRMGQKLNGLDPNKRSDNTMEATRLDMYACGFLPPNYPVPTIPLQVTFPWNWDAEFDLTSQLYVSVWRMIDKHEGQLAVEFGPFV